jgi:adenine phosphoribosyltransferase
MSDQTLERAADLLRAVPDYPKPGILFWDIAPVLRDPTIRKHIIKLMAARWDTAQVDVIAGFDARGFIFGTPLSDLMDVPFEQIRKKGKLPGNTRALEYTLEYGSAIQEMIDDGFLAGKRVLLVDDLLATGGTALCGAKLVEELGGIVVGISVVTELPELGGRGLLADYQVHSLITAVGHQKVIDAEYCVDMVPYDAHTGELVLIERLSEPVGLATPGGHIEQESGKEAATREPEEEIGCAPKLLQYHSTLTTLDRDPRGPKISVVMSCLVDSGTTVNEPGKTKVIKAVSPESLPDDTSFVLGHGPIVRQIWQELLKS